MLKRILVSLKSHLDDLFLKQGTKGANGTLIVQVLEDGIGSIFAVELWREKFQNRTKNDF